jgi:hypothetical protein
MPDEVRKIAIPPTAAEIAVAQDRVELCFLRVHVLERNAKDIEREHPKCVAAWEAAKAELAHLTAETK